MERPLPDETDPYYHRYISQVPDGPILDHLRRQGEATADLFAGLDEDRAMHRYEPGKWSVKQVLGHVLDVERAFAFRGLAFARRDPHELPSFDQDSYVEHGGFDRRAIADLAAEFRAVRQATLRQYAGFDPQVGTHRGIASDFSFTVRSTLWIIAGHELHHLAVLRDRYRIG